MRVEGNLVSTKRLAALLLAVPLAFAPTASADPIVEGCWGVSVVVCDPELRTAPVETGTQQIPVCSGTCRYISAPTADLTHDYQVCVDYTTTQGTARSQCALPEGFEEIAVYCGLPFVDSICW